MFYNSLVTICMTMGNRPDELRTTLNSLSPELRALPFIAINDFQDEETNRVFKEIVPHGKIIDQRGQIGHNRAIDATYGQVQTPYIFHLEDDWTFTRTDFLEDGLKLLTSDPAVTMVLLRDRNDMRIKAELEDKIISGETSGISWLRLDETSDKWYGYTFNPHLSRKQTWLDLGGFAQFRGEMHVSRHFRHQNRYCLVMDPGACHHGGAKNSVRKKMHREQREKKALQH